jgi:hypothetical protein
MAGTITLPPVTTTMETLPTVFPTQEPEYSPSVISPPMNGPAAPTVTFRTSSTVTGSKTNIPSTWTSPPAPTTFTSAAPPLPTTTIPSTTTAEPGAPGQVTGLTALANGTDGVKLTWNRLQADNILCYNVYRSINAGGPYNPIAWPAENSYNNTGLEYGTTYYYCVSAVDCFYQEGEKSAEVSAVNFSLMTVPVLLELFSRQN